MPVYLIEGRGGAGKSLYIIDLIHKYMRIKDFINEQRSIYLVNFDSKPLLHTKFPQVKQLNIIEDVFKDCSLDYLKEKYSDAKYQQYLNAVENFDNSCRSSFERKNGIESEYIMSCRALTILKSESGDAHMRHIFPDGSLIIFDEAHDYFRAKSCPTNSHPSDFMKYLATCRHFGVDFYFLTQDSKKLDPEIRRNITYHHYITRIFNSNFAKVKIFEEMCDTPQRTVPLLKIRIHYKKSYFPLYNSTSVDTFKHEVAAKLPLLRFMLPVIAFVAAILVLYVSFFSMPSVVSVEVSKLPDESIVVNTNEGVKKDNVVIEESEKTSKELKNATDNLISAFETFSTNKSKAEKVFPDVGKLSLDNYFLSGVLYGEKLSQGLFIFKKFEFLSSGKLAGCRSVLLQDIQVDI